MIVVDASAVLELLPAYDAAYLALAESLPAPLITCDIRLAAAPGHRATIELLQANRA